MRRGVTTLKTFGKLRRAITAALAVIFVMALIPPAPAGAMHRTSAVVSAGTQHVMVVKSDGSLWGWGSTSGGNLGDGTNAKLDSVVKSPKKIMTNVKSVSAGSIVSAIIKTDNSLWMCGDGTYGAIGDGTTNIRTTPVKVMDNVASVTTSGTTTFAIKTDGSLWGWGRNSDGQVGNGTTDDTDKNHILKPVKIMDGVASVSMGELNVNMAIKTDGSLWTWGIGYYGLLGNGTKENKSAPVKVMDDVAFVSAGRYHAAVIKKDGSLWAWGELGFLDQYTTVGSSLTPVKILENADADFIYSEYSYIAMIKKDKSLWLLGKDEAFGDKKKFEKIMDDVAIFDRGYGTKVVLKTDGSLWTWGGNSFGTIGDGTRTITRVESTGMGLHEVMVEDHTRYSPYKVMNDVMPPPVPLAPIDSASDWAKESIKKAVAAGFVPADLQDNYRRNITRGEYCRMAVTYIETRTKKAIGAYLTEKGLSVDKSAFTDTQDVNILSAYALGIVGGRGNRIFDPNGAITREEAAVMVRNLQRVLGYSVDNFPDSGFADSGKISGWAVEGINYVYANGIMSGIGNNVFDPRGTYTREQAIITFLNIFEK